MIGIVLTIVFVVLIAPVLIALLVALYAKITGGYLNRYYIFSRKRSGEYELHCHPAFGFYYATPAKFFAMREDAIRRFRRRHPDATLFAVTITLQGFYEQNGYVGEPVNRKGIKRLAGRILDYVLILCNLANYRKRNKREWQFARLIRRVNRTIPHRYVVFEQMNVCLYNKTGTFVRRSKTMKQKWFPLGRRSLLFGVHQLIWHPWTVYRAWKSLYGHPNWREVVCIIIHDWGYWSASNIDGPEGQRHPELGARIARWLFGDEYGDLVLYHSRHYARLHGQPPSKLCWADKLSILYEPKWFYLLRAKLSGEIHEFRLNVKETFGLERPHSEWFDWLRGEFLKLAITKRADVVPYHRRNESAQSDSHSV